MLVEPRDGKIITFYSFKGGVGRTMALANVAYLAAYHHKKVLVMDWDLEAPGLLYYFRGLSSPELMEGAKHSKGVLNLLWEWHLAASGVADAQQMDELLSKFQQGHPFSACAHSIADPQALGFEGSLHYMSAGSPYVQTGVDQHVAYAQALSMFPWPEFYKDSVGGALIDLWRRWAKANYDLILIDSRTGLADVAGLCTMQMPDEVALCLVLNRQNIDGTGRVAASIRENREGAIGMRALPMRVARADTSEESDARARAFAVLIKTGGFSLEQVTKDFSQLSIPASENVPFYETLAPFSTQDPTLDLLTLNYCRMASSLIGQDITPPVIDEGFRQQVRRRQSHDRRSATVDYVNKLAAAEPARAIDELSRLVDSAWAAVHDDDQLDKTYVDALVDAATMIETSDFEGEIALIREALQQLLRRLYTDHPSEWRETYVFFLSRLLDSDELLMDTSMSEYGLLEEIDYALSNDWSTSGILRRLSYRRRAAWYTWNQADNAELAKLVVNEVRTVLGFATQSKAPTHEQQIDIACAYADMDMLLGEMAIKQSNLPEALSHFLDASGRTTPPDGDWGRARTEARRLSATANVSIALRFPPEMVACDLAANHALKALEAQPGMLLNAQRFLQLCELFAKLEVSQTSTFVFISKFLNQPLDRAGRGPFAGTMGLRTTILAKMIDQLTLLAEKSPYSQIPAIGGAALRVLDAAKVRLYHGAAEPVNIHESVHVLVRTLLAAPEASMSQELMHLSSSLTESAKKIDSKMRPEDE